MKYNFFKEQNIEISKISDHKSFETFQEPSTFLKDPACQNVLPHFDFNFIATTEHNVIKPFFITITAQRFSNVYYAYDSTAFCIVKYNKHLDKGKRYIIYGKVSKLNLYFVECLGADEICYKNLCYSLI